MPSKVKTLLAIQEKIDSIDTEILKLLDLRFVAMKEIALVKKTQGISYAPDREAASLRSLIQKNTGGLKSRVLVKIWREIVSAMEQLYHPFAVSVYTQEHPHVMMELAKDYFGTDAKCFSCISVSQAIQKVDSQEAGVAVLPLFNQQESWWSGLGSKEYQNLRIVARLPFSKPSEESVINEAFVISMVEPEKTGSDRTIFAVELMQQTSIGALKTLFEKSGFQVVQVCPAYDLPEIYLFAVEVDGYVTLVDRRIVDFQEQNEKNIQMIRRIGGYAVQEVMTEDNLSNEGIHGHS